MIDRKSLKNLLHQNVNVALNEVLPDYVFNSLNAKVATIWKPVNWFEPNQLTGFYMMAILAFNELRKRQGLPIFIH